MFYFMNYAYLFLLRFCHSIFLPSHSWLVFGGVGGGLQSRFSLFYLLSLYYSGYGRHFCEKMKEISHLGTNY